MTSSFRGSVVRPGCATLSWTMAKSHVNNVRKVDLTGSSDVGFSVDVCAIVHKRRQTPMGMTVNSYKGPLPFDKLESASWILSKEPKLVGEESPSEHHMDAHMDSWSMINNLPSEMPSPYYLHLQLKWSEEDFAVCKKAVKWTKAVSNELITSKLIQTFNSPDYSDVVITCADGVEFLVNKLPLASMSPWFSRLFETDMKEMKEGKVSAESFTSEAVEHMLKHFYGGLPDFEHMPIDTMCDLFKAADYYEVPNLMEMVEEQLEARVASGTFSAILSVVWQPGSHVLRKACSRWMKQNKDITENHGRLDELLKGVFGNKADLLAELLNDLL